MPFIKGNSRHAPHSAGTTPDVGVPFTFPRDFEGKSPFYPPISIHRAP